MARWSLFEKRHVESLSRVLTARTLDGYRVRAKLAVNFTRLLSEAETEALATAYAEAFKASIEVEICEGRLPFDDVSLHRLLTERVREMPPSRVRVNGAHLIQPGSASSQSMPAVRAPSSHAGGGSLPPLRHPSNLPRSHVPASMRSPVAQPSRAPQPARSVPVSPAVSGFMPAQRQPMPEALSFTRVVLAAQAATSLPALGAELGRAVRGAAASLLLTALHANEAQLTDPLAVLEGRLDPVVTSGLVQEACVSMAYVLHRALLRSGTTEKHAIVLVQEAARVALHGAQMPVADMSRYFATDMPAEEFHKTFCRLLGIKGADASESALVEAVERLAQDALICASVLLQSAARAALLDLATGT